MLPTILLVDDEEDLLDFLERNLNDIYRTVKAKNGKEALDILKQEVIQLIICDIMMPEMDGFEFLKAVKSDFECSHIPVILLTAKNTIQSKVHGLELDADAYIEKPFSKEHLKAQIASLLSNRNMLREYFANSPLQHIKSIAHSKADEHFLEALHNAISDNMENPDLDIETIAGILNMSRVTLYRKIKLISNLSPLELINIIRLKKAAELLAMGEYKIYEIAVSVGYSSQSNFTRQFHKQFNLTPTEFIQSKRQK